MDRKETPGPHWDREQMARDTEGPPEGEQQDPVWNRHEWASDEGAVERDAATGTEPGVEDDPAAGGLSGHGQPSGESHWERNDPTE
jgi:hypothetical protein